MSLDRGEDGLHLLAMVNIQKRGGAVHEERPSSSGTSMAERGRRTEEAGLVVPFSSHMVPMTAQSASVR